MGDERYCKHANCIEYLGTKTSPEVVAQFAREPSKIETSDAALAINGNGINNAKF